MSAGNVAQNIISFVAHGARVEIHRHYCFQLVVSLNAPFDCTINGTTYKDQTGLIINQNIPHSCMAQQASVLLYFIDAESYFGWQLKELLGAQPFLDTQPFFTPEQRAFYYVPENQQRSKEQLQQMADEIFSIILPAASQPSTAFLDERIVSAIDWIEKGLQTDLKLEAMADLIYLSPERTRHLFAQTTGVPFSQFVLWKRIKQVITLAVRDGFSLTSAAVESGFADQAHFCRIFKRVFGISAKALLKNSRSVQFLNPLT